MGGQCQAQASLYTTLARVRLPPFTYQTVVQQQQTR